jgi:uncharacterized protein YpuA (DUF1002 family)
MNKKIKTADELGTLGRRLEMAGKFLQLAEKVSEIQKNLRRAQIEEAREIIIDVSERLNVNYPPEKSATEKIGDVPTYPGESFGE